MPREQENRSILVGRSGESIRCLHIFVEGVYFRVDLSSSFERPSHACYVMGYIHIGSWLGKASGTGTIWGAGLEGEGGGFRVAFLKVNVNGFAVKAAKLWVEAAAFRVKTVALKVNAAALGVKTATMMARAAAIFSVKTVSWVRATEQSLHPET